MICVLKSQSSRQLQLSLPHYTFNGEMVWWENIVLPGSQRQTDHKVLPIYLRNEDDGNQQGTTTKGFRKGRKKQHKRSRKHCLFQKTKPSDFSLEPQGGHFVWLKIIECFCLQVIQKVHLNSLVEFQEFLSQSTLIFLNHPFPTPPQLILTVNIQTLMCLPCFTCLSVDAT